MFSLCCTLLLNMAPENTIHRPNDSNIVDIISIETVYMFTVTQLSLLWGHVLVVSQGAGHIGKLSGGV